MQRFREPETQWDQHRPPGSPRPRESRRPQVEAEAKSPAAAQSNDGLRGILQRKLRQDVNLRGYGLEATVIDQVARVQGVVDTLAEKLYIRELVTSIPGISGYEDGVSISTDGAITDEQVKMEISEELDTHPASSGNVGVQVCDGTAYLKGRVPSKEVEAEIIRLASSARGVIQVVSQLRIDPDRAGP
ncbi:MAG: BON domain-containing protein [Firmicutes bacterium]|jgi:hyperosmotically inducible protein|nr:BON domain-containing protein [Bacillota bacterium]